MEAEKQTAVLTGKEPEDRNPNERGIEVKRTNPERIWVLKTIFATISDQKNQ